MTQLFSALAFAGFSLMVSAAHAGFPPPDEMLCYEDCAQTHSHEYCLARCYGTTERLQAVESVWSKITMQSTECRTQNSAQAPVSRF